MRLLKKSFLVLLITAVLVSAVPPGITRAGSGVIYQSSEKETLTSGATLERITRFTDEGWLNMNVIRVDLSNQYIKVDTISDPGPIKYLNNTKALAETRGAVAAINGGFFNWISGGGYADGPLMESGKIVSADNEYNRYSDSMGTFAISQLNEALYNYWKTDITLTAPNGASTVVMQYNKPSKQQYTDFTIIDRRWSEASIGNIYNDIVEMVVEDGKVKEIRQNQPALEIPQNGYVVVTRQQGSSFISTNFKVGDEVKYDIATNPDWSNLQMAVTGSAILVKDGKIPDKFSMNIEGRHPRTVIGSSQDDKQLFLVTIDGRQKGSLGMTQTEAASFMLELGAYNALNLDGGGSTTMVAREAGGSAINVVNTPSDGIPRAVSNAVGVFSIAPPSELDGFIIESVDSNVFVNTSRDFTVKGYDRYFNPIAVNAGDIKWSVKGIDGYFEGNRFFPKAAGKGKIVATLGKASSEVDVTVLSSPVELKLSDRLAKLSPGQSKSFTLSGKNQEGFSAVINPLDVSWSVNGNIGSFERGAFKAAQGGTGYIEAAVGNARAYCGVSVGYTTETLKDGFEAVNGSFTSYPSFVKGSYEISREQKFSGSSSGKLTYDFTNTEGSRAAYIAFSNGGVKIDAGTSALGLQVHNNHQNSNWLRAEITDVSGKKHTVDFARTLEWTGWKSVQASLEGIPLPATLNRIYLVQVSPVSDSGHIYVDNLAFLSAKGFPEIDTSKIPANSEYSDESIVSEEYIKEEGSFRFSVLGQSSTSRTLLEKLLLAIFTEKSNTSYEAAAFIGPGDHEFANKLKVLPVNTGKGYKSFDLKNSRFLQLDISGGGIRSGAAGQWQWFLQELSSFKGDNVFIFMPDVTENFSDSAEAELFHKILADYRKDTGRNVWVLSKWGWNTTKMEQGVKYITVSGLDGGGLSPENTDAAKMLVVTVKGKKITMAFKPIA